MAWAELSDVRCYYESLGKGEPVLLIQGLGNTCRSWDDLSAELAEHFTVILIDNRGIGQSEAKRQPETLSDYASDFVELLDFLQLDRVHVIGISLGGVMAQKLAVEHPQRVDRLVLISCAHHFGPYLREMAALLGKTIRLLPYKTSSRTVELLGTGPLYLDEHPQRIAEQVRAKASCHVSRRAIVRQLRCLAASDVAPADYHITAPTLVIAGEYDPIIPACYDRKMADDIPGSRLLVVPGAGHNPVIECPEMVVPAIVNFLKEGSHGRKRHSFKESLKKSFKERMERHLRPQCSGRA